MDNIIDITNQIKDKIRKEKTNKELLDIAELINDGYVKEIVGVLVDYNGIHYAMLPNDVDEITGNDFKRILKNYANKIPTK